ncbi:septum formation initiator family protein [Lentilactobacillus sp. Marseille-Q4993]|uniref:FtsB family cell division protein n=1 Tax=Lentilactobacillus sp. Marseille-Q4993 TaxID=3039492 RepID=UPI0024BC34E4|nr:septum formation initiator family protein [Lentilactobacillus sp. Marseille-Q4993]
MTQSNKIKKLENDFTRKKEQELQKHKIFVNLSRRRRRRAIGLISVIVAFTFICAVQIIQAKANLMQVNGQIENRQANLRQQKAKNKELTVKVDQLNDKSYVEKLIRQRYYYTKPGETVYSFPDKSIDDLR